MVERWQPKASAKAVTGILAARMSWMRRRSAKSI